MGFWIGINKPGRLPSASRQLKKHEATGAEAPSDEVQKYLESTPETLASQWLVIGNPMVSKALVLGLVSDSASVQAPDKYSSSEPVGSDGDDSDTNSSPAHSDAAERIANHLIALMKRNFPRAKTPKNIRGWVVEADRMMRLDGRTEQEIVSVMEWALADSFWSSNILSVPKLRKKFDQLSMQRSRKTPGRPKSETSFAGIDYRAGTQQKSDGSLEF